MTLNIITLKEECCYAEGNLCLVSFMLSVANKPFVPSVVILNVIMPNVVAPTSGTCT
jgi:hypothetical protein